MSESDLSALVASLGAKQLKDLAVQVDEAKRRTQGAEQAESDARATAKLDSVTQVPDELLSSKVISPKEELHWVRRSETARAAQNKDKKTLVATEASRHKAVSQLAVSFSKLTGARLGNKWYTHFEAWLFARRQACTGADAILPLSKKGSFTPADLELRRKLIAAGEAAAAVDAICAELADLPNRLFAKIPKNPARQLHVKVSPFKGEKGDLDKLRLTWQGVSVEVNTSHYNKLRSLFVQSNQATVAADSTAFTHAAMILLLRYSSLQGTHYRGGGFQAAIHHDVFDALESGFDCQMECFASPMNCRWRRYCSMFVDTDVPFGSLGSFFSFRPLHGSFEANPPFDKVFVSKMASHMFQLLAVTEKPLMFTVIIPTWEGALCWKTLQKSTFNHHHLTLEAGEHGYCEGAQHNRANRYRVASTGTSVFFLQNAAACKKWPITEAKVESIRAAFAPKANASKDGVKVTNGESGTALEAGTEGHDALIGGDFSKTEDVSELEDVGVDALGRDDDSDESNEPEVDEAALKSTSTGKRSADDDGSGGRAKKIRRGPVELRRAVRTLRSAEAGTTELDPSIQVQTKRGRAKSGIVVAGSSSSGKRVKGGLGLRVGGVAKKARKSGHGTGKFAADEAVKSVMEAVIAEGVAPTKAEKTKGKGDSVVVDFAQSNSQRKKQLKAAQAGRRRIPESKKPRVMAQFDPSSHGNFKFVPAKDPKWQ